VIPAAPDAPSFPPLLRGEEVPKGQSPFEKAMARAAVGTDPGLVTWAAPRERLQAAIVLAPEVALERALPASFAIALGLGDALGALAPPEVAVHHVWPDRFRVNGALCGRMRVAASTGEPAAEPGWMVVGIEMPFAPEPGTEPGARAEETWLHEEGCAEITPAGLLESWARHSLVWLNTWEKEGLGPLHEAWRTRAWGLGEPLPDGGVFVGLDELGGQLVKTGGGTELRPLTAILEPEAA
jgi:biotin-(acetyl-CoA carboxylase) ligase